MLPWMKIKGKNGYSRTTLKIQDGRHIKWILDYTIEFPILENMGIDTKIMSLHGLEVKLESHIGILAAILKILQ